jgi:hypothetical protein
VQLIIDSHGTARCVYAETVNLAKIGRLTITRGSHVEPTGNGQWTTDLSPVGGPKLGPYSLRSEALAAEAAWLTAHWLPRLHSQ